MSRLKSVAIVGAGASGLVCAKVFLDDGFDVTLFDRQRELGGIWCAESAYADLHSQQPGGTYEFSDLFDGEEFASWQRIHNYLKRYADLFHITERIRFQTQVVSIYKDDIKNAALPWLVKIVTVNGEQETLKFDFVVVASGLFAQPNIPHFRGENKFIGQIVRPSEIKSHEQLSDKRVILIGSGKCALDMAVLAGRFARSCHLVFRKAHWSAPRVIFGGRLPLRALCTRASTVFSTPFPDAPHTVLFRFLHRTFPNFFQKMTDNIGDDIIAIHGPDLFGDKIFLPHTSFRNEHNLSIIPNDFIRLKKEGRIVGKLASVDEIVDATTIRLDSGEELQADMIISATGFIRQFPFFLEKHAQMMGVSTAANGHANTSLYRQVLPVGIPNIGFIGFAAGVQCWTLSEVASHWLSDYFLNRLKLPSEREMLEIIKRRRTFLDELFHDHESNMVYYWVGPLDTYLKDMGLALHRTNNWITEYFGIYRPERLKGLHEERRIKAEKGIAPYHWYFSFEHTLCLIFLLLLFLFFIYAL